jgi:hypothetical protein
MVERKINPKYARQMKSAAIGIQELELSYRRAAPVRIAQTRQPIMKLPSMLEVFMVNLQKMRLRCATKALKNHWPK